MGFLSGIGGIVGTVAGALTGHSTNKANQAMNDANNATMIELANTGVTRKVKDLEANGLNKLLSVSSASTGAPVPTLTASRKENYDVQNIANGINAMSAIANVKQAEANIRKTNAEADRVSGLLPYEAEGLRLENNLRKEGVLNTRVERELTKAKSDNERVNILVNSFRAQGEKVNVEQAKKMLEILAIRKLQEERNLGAWKNTTWGQNFGSVYGGILDTANTVSGFIPHAPARENTKYGNSTYNNSYREIKFYPSGK